MKLNDPSFPTEESGTGLTTIERTTRRTIDTESEANKSSLSPQLSSNKSTETASNAAETWRSTRRVRRGQGRMTVAAS